MTNKLNFLVTDSNIWIDLINAGLVELFFLLPYSFFAPDFLRMYELIGISWIGLEKHGLQFIGLDEVENNELFSLKQRYMQPSLPDLAAYLVTRKIGGILLTGDKNLRKLAEKNMEVHGSLWIFDELIEHGILTKNNAFNSLTLLLDNKQTRLPRIQCEKRFKRWKNL